MLIGYDHGILGNKKKNIPHTLYTPAYAPHTHMLPYPPPTIPATRRAESESTDSERRRPTESDGGDTLRPTSPSRPNTQHSAEVASTYVAPQQGHAAPHHHEIVIIAAAKTPHILQVARPRPGGPCDQFGANDHIMARLTTDLHNSFADLAINVVRNHKTCKAYTSSERDTDLAYLHQQLYVELQLLSHIPAIKAQSFIRLVRLMTMAVSACQICHIKANPVKAKGAKANG